MLNRASVLPDAAVTGILAGRGVLPLAIP